MTFDAARGIRNRLGGPVRTAVIGFVLALATFAGTKAVPAPPPGAMYFTITPCRLLDTRRGSPLDNGVPLEQTSWIEEGRLERLRYHRAGAAKSGVPFAPPVDNLILDLPGASSSLDDLVASCERGLLLTCLWYIREVDPATLLLTGLTRDGVYLVEGGEVVGAVNNFRFNQSPLDLLRDTVAAGASERALSREWGEWMERTKMPPLRVADFNMSSVSPAN